MTNMVGRGRLLSKERELDIESKRKTWAQGTRAMLGFGLGCLLLIPLLWALGMNLIAAVIVVAPPCIGLAFLALATWSAHTRLAPFSVYENGMAVQTTLDWNLFVPWGMVLRWEEWTHMPSAMLDSDSEEPRGHGGVPVTLRGNGSCKQVLRPSLPGFKEWIEVVKSKVGSKAVQSPEFDKAMKRDFLVISVGIALLSVWGGVMLIGIFNLGTMLAGGGLLPLVLGGLGIGAVLLPLLHILHSTYTWGLPRGPAPIAVPVVVTLVLLSLLAVALHDPGLDAQRYELEVHEDAEPWATALEPGTHVGLTASLGHPVRVRGGETLVLRDCDLTFDPPPAGQWGIWVGEGGRLEMYNTTVDCVRIEQGYSFEVHGSAVVDGCHLSRMWGDPAHENGDGGLEVYSNDVRVSNTTFTMCSTNLLMVVRCAPVVEGCSFLGSMDDGIEVGEGSPIIRDCEFTGCEWAVSHLGGRATVEGCTFVDNEWGVCLVWADGTVRECDFRGTAKAAVLVNTDGDVTFMDNTFEGNSDDVLRQRWFDLYTQPLLVQVGRLCLPMVAVPALLLLAVVVQRYRKIQVRGGSPSTFGDSSGWDI